MSKTCKTSKTHKNITNDRLDKKRTSGLVVKAEDSRPRGPGF
jgi:hypothetical protein